MDASDLAVIELLYQSVGDPLAWEEALASLAKTFCANHVHLVAIQQRSLLQPIIETSGIDPSDAAIFQSQRAWELWQPLEKLLTRGRAFAQNEHILDQDFERSDFYNEIVRKVGTFYGLAYHSANPNAQAYLTICRARGGGGFTRDEADRLNRIAGHLDKAVSLHSRLRLDEHRTLRYEATLDEMADGVILINRTGQVVFVNRRAHQLTYPAEAFIENARCLKPGTRPQMVRLADVIVDVLSQKTDGAVRLYRPLSEDIKTPMILDIQRMSRVSLTICGDVAHIAIFIRGVERALYIDREAVEHIYGLTRRESEIATALALGLNVEKIAKQTTLTVNTVRFYLKKIFEKTGTPNQAGLVTVLGAFARNGR